MEIKINTKYKLLRSKDEKDEEHVLCIKKKVSYLLFCRLSFGYYS